MPDRGDLYNVRGEFRDPGAANQTADELANGGRLVDPTTVIFSKQTPAPASVKTSYTYGVDVEVIKDAVGKYRYQLSLDEVGVYICKWRSTGVGQAATPDFRIEVGRTVF